VKFIYTIILIALTYSFQANAQSKSNVNELTVKTEVFCDHCNHCESCKPRVETALFASAGVKKVKLDIEAQTIHVVFNPKKTNSEEIKKVILSTGYAADGVQPKPEDYAKLDGCCKRK
jgi:periplasmic mercuric ion binding protein